MKHNILIICGTNFAYMPYLKNYTDILDSNEIKYDLLVWDRLKLDEKSEFVYKDKQKSLRRNFFDYYHFSCFVKKVLKQYNYDKIIIFGIQIMFFCQKFIPTNFAKKYIFDIRDYHILAKGIDFKRVISNAQFTVISSPGYKKFLPNGFEYIMNHNTTIDNAVLVNNKTICFNSKLITYMGALRDLDINKKLILALRDSSYEAYFAGESDYTQQLKDFVDRGCFNVKFSGRYKKEEEKVIYDQTLLVNVLRYADSFNNKVALPNRLYNAPIHMKPLLSFNDTYLSKIIEDYNLGLVLCSFENLSQKIDDYLNQFDFEKYYDGRKRFLSKVIQDNLYFKQMLLEFCQNN